MRTIAPQVPTRIDAGLPHLKDFHIEPGENSLELIQRAARQAGAWAWISRGTLVISKTPTASSFRLTESSKILSLEIDENLSKVFDEMLDVSQVQEDSHKRRKILNLSARMVELKRRQCEACHGSPSH